jgi:hypothetical protein
MLLTAKNARRRAERQAAIDAQYAEAAAAAAAQGVPSPSPTADLDCEREASPSYYAPGRLQPRWRRPVSRVLFPAPPLPAPPPVPAVLPPPVAVVAPLSPPPLAAPEPVVARPADGSDSVPSERSPEFGPSRSPPVPSPVRALARAALASHAVLTRRRVCGACDA